MPTIEIESRKRWTTFHPWLLAQRYGNSFVENVCRLAQEELAAKGNQSIADRSLHLADGFADARDVLGGFGAVAFHGVDRLECRLDFGNRRFGALQIGAVFVGIVSLRQQCVSENGVGQLKGQKAQLVVLGVNHHDDAVTTKSIEQALPLLRILLGDNYDAASGVTVFHRNGKLIEDAVFSVERVAASLGFDDDLLIVKAVLVDVDEHIATIEKEILELAMNQSGNVLARAAKLVGLSYQTLSNRLERFGAR